MKMKKWIIAFVGAVLIGMLALSAVAATPLSAQKREESAAVSHLQEEKGSFGQIVVDGETTEIVACILVPLEETAGVLGFTVTEEKDGTIRVDNGTMHTNLTVGEDRYIVATSMEGMVGMSAPFSLGMVPVKMNDKIYVPIGTFQAFMGNREDSLTLRENAVLIRTKQGEAENTQIPNPICECAALAELEEKVGFTVKQLKAPKGYTNVDMIAIDGTVAEFRFVLSSFAGY